MAAANNNRYYGAGYQTGSAARALPDRYVETLRRERKEQIKMARADLETRVDQKRLAANEFSKVQMLVIAAAAALFLAAISLFIVRLSVQETTKNAIERLEKEIQTVHHENAIMQNLRNSSVDYDSLYVYVTEELGMRVPEKQQVLYYTQPGGEYVTKNGDIPR